MALDALDAALPGIGYESLVRLGVARAEGDVAHGAAFGVCRALEEVAIVDGAVEQVGFCSVALRHGDEPVGLLDPAEDLSAQVDAKGVGCVVHGALFGLDAHIQVGGAYVGAGRPVCDEVLAHDHHGHARGPRVFLRAGEQQAVALDVERTG